MKFLAVDDERLALEELESLLREVMPEHAVYACSSAKAAIEFADRDTFDIAFLDIELGSTNGIFLAKQLKDRQPDMHIIFVTSHSHYAVEAFAIHATGYLLKPLQKEQMQREMTFLYREDKHDKKVKVQTFGGFEVWVAGERVAFKRKKAKELLAYLIERKGVSVTIREAYAVLFEDAVYDRAAKNYFQTILASLKRTLKEVGAGDILLKSYNSLAIDPDTIDCDYYRFLDGDSKTVNSYRGEFMTQYSWAEFSAAELGNRKIDYSGVGSAP